MPHERPHARVFADGRHHGAAGVPARRRLPLRNTLAPSTAIAYPFVCN
ncbi:hypothetical protein Y027_5189 [Burkholderia pseudomallei TSV5]|nr:hypothetical protein Y027_5189 [Burkholderia pseudomallei TSV5]